MSGPAVVTPVPPIPVITIAPGQPVQINLVIGASTYSLTVTLSTTAAGGISLQTDLGLPLMTDSGSPISEDQ